MANRRVTRSRVLEVATDVLFGASLTLLLGSLSAYITFRMFYPAP